MLLHERHDVVDMLHSCLENFNENTSYKNFLQITETEMLNIPFKIDSKIFILKQLRLEIFLKLVTKKLHKKHSSNILFFAINHSVVSLVNWS